MTSIETQQHLKAILRDSIVGTMSGNYYESAMVIPGMHASAMPRKPARPSASASSNAAAMRSEETLVDKDGIPITLKEKADIDSLVESSTPSRKGFVKRFFKKA